MRNLRNASRRIRHAVVAGLACAVVAGCANSPSTTGSGSSGTTSAPASETPPTGAIIIGEYGSMTGAQSTFGQSTDNGIEMAVDDINKAGGVNGHQLFVKLYNDEGDPQKTATVAQLLANQDHPTAVLGEVASGLSQMAAPVFNAAKIPMISPSSTNPKVTEIGPYIFRVCFIDPFQGTAAAKFAIQSLHAKTAAIFTDAKSQYSLGLHDFFKKSFESMGGTVVAEKTYTADDTTFQSQLADIKAANPDILYVPGYYSNIGPIAKQARDVGLTVPLMGGDGWDSPKLIEGAGGPGGALEGCYFTNHYSVDNPSPAVQAFVTEYAAKYNDKPDALAALGYDAAGVLVAAIKTAGAPADGDYTSDAYRAKLRDAIAATKGYPGITGKITLGPDRNAVKPAVVLQIHGAGYTYKTTINP